MKRIFAAMTAALMIVATFGTAAVAAGGTGITATPASTVTWADTYTAQFVRSASGIINETNRVNSAGPQNGWTSADVYLQFRPSPGTPANPACDPNGLVTPVFTYVNTDSAIAGTTTSGYFLAGVTYNVCVYLVNPQVASGTIDSSAIAGTTANLQGLNGRFRVTVSGTYANDGLNVADAEYTSIDGWTTVTNGYDISPWFLGEGFGDVQVNSLFVDWGAYTSTHTYSTLLTSGSINLAVFDGDSNTNTKVSSWYGDNVGSLTYTITYLGLQLLAVGLGIDYVIMSGNLVAH